MEECGHRFCDGFLFHRWSNAANDKRMGLQVRGQILDFSIQDNTGVISAEDGSRYTFAGSEWQEKSPPSRGMKVDFEIQGDRALAVYRAIGNSSSLITPGSKSKVAAGVLAILLGPLGIHKFYLGYTGPGLVYLLTTTVGLLTTIFMLGIPNFVLGIIALVEGVIYLTLSDEDFEQTYVVGTKHWF